MEFTTLKLDTSKAKEFAYNLLKEQNQLFETELIELQFLLESDKNFNHYGVKEECVKVELYNPTSSRVYLLGVILIKNLNTDTLGKMITEGWEDYKDLFLETLTKEFKEKEMEYLKMKNQYEKLKAL